MKPREERPGSSLAAGSCNRNKLPTMSEMPPQVQHQSYPSQPTKRIGPTDSHLSTDQQSNLSKLEGQVTDSVVSSQASSSVISGSPLLSLPVELFLEIFSWIAEPYSQVAYVSEVQIGRAGSFQQNPEQTYRAFLCLPPSRTWQSMKVFHICRAFRRVAIARYGQPCRDAPPFYPKLDTLDIQGVDVNPAIKQLMPRNDGPNPIRVDEHQLSEVRNGRIFYQFLSRRSSQPHCDECPKHGFLERVTQAKVCVVDSVRRFRAFTYPDFDRFPRVIGIALPNLEELELDDSRSPVNTMVRTAIEYMAVLSISV